MRANSKSTEPTPKPAVPVKWEVWMGMNAWYIVGDIGTDSWLQVSATDYLQPLGKPRISDARKQAADLTVSDLVRTHRYRGADGSYIRKLFESHLAKIKRLAPAVFA